MAPTNQLWPARYPASPRNPATIPVMAKGHRMARYVGPRVRIPFAPAASQERTLRDVALGLSVTGMARRGTGRRAPPEIPPGPLPFGWDGWLAGQSARRQRQEQRSV